MIEDLAAALGGQQAGGVGALVDERTLLHLSGSCGLAGDYQGRGAIRELLEWMATACDGTLHFQTVDTSSEEPDELRMRGRIQAARLGQRVDESVVLEVAFVGDAVREVSVWFQDQAAWDAFWT